MQAIVLNESFELGIRAVNDPDPGHGEVLVQPSVVGVCGSDIHGVLSRSPRRTPPLIMGHEIAGIAVAVGPDTDDSIVGQRVAVNPQLPCRDCVDCRAGREHLCLRRGLIGGTQGGGLAELVTVPLANCHVLPEQLQDDRAALIEPFATCVHAINLATSSLPDEVLVLGGGAVGRLMAELLGSLPGSRIFVSEPDESRRGLVRRATSVVPDEVPDLVSTVTGGRGFGLIVDAVGAGATRRQSIDALSSGGTALWIGMDAHDCNIDGFALVTREQRVLGSFAYTDQEFATAMRILADSDIGAVDVAEALNLTDALSAFNQLLSGHSTTYKLAVKPN